MIKNARHVGFVVQDIKKSLHFYKDFLGLNIWKQDTEIGPYIDNVVGIKDVKIEWIKLQSKDGFLIELLQYHSHPESPSKQTFIPSNKLHSAHVAFTVDNLDKVYSKLTKNNYHCNSKPQHSPNGLVKVLYCHDPDGISVELVEELK
jgi:catechol 2,3-dioxygenase-like lactoylglutathione lyase family enzyme